MPLIFKLTLNERAANYLSLKKKVYKRIESLLLKTKQEKIKKDTFDGYLNNTELKIGKDFEIYFN